MKDPVYEVGREELAELRRVEDPIEWIDAELTERERAQEERKKRLREKTLKGALRIIRASGQKAKVRRTDPRSAHETAMSVLEKAPVIRERLFWAFYEMRKLTAHEAAEIINYDPWSASSSVSELKNLELVEETGERRETGRGGTAEVLRCTVPRGRLECRQAELQLEGAA